MARAVLMDPTLSRASEVGPDLPEEPVEALFREPPREGVLLRGVVGGEEAHPVPEVVTEPMAEGEPPRPFRVALLVHREESGKGEVSEDEDRAEVREELPLASEVVPAKGGLLPARLVVRGGAAHDRRDVAIRKPQAVVPPGREGGACEVGAVECREEEVPGAIPGEDTARAVSSVGGRREAHDPERGVLVPEAGHGTAPVGLLPEALDALLGDPLAPGPEARAALAGDDVPLQGGEGVPHPRVRAR